MSWCGPGDWSSITPRDEDGSFTTLWDTEHCGVQDHPFDAVSRAAPAIDTAERCFDGADGRRATASETRDILDQYQSGKKAFGKPKECEQKTRTRVGETRAPIPAPLRRLRERLARRSPGQHAQFTGSDPEVFWRESLCDCGDVTGRKQVPLGPIHCDAGASVLVYLYAGDGPETGVLETEIEPTQPGEGGEDGG